MLLGFCGGRNAVLWCEYCGVVCFDVQKYNKICTYQNVFVLLQAKNILRRESRYNIETDTGIKADMNRDRYRHKSRYEQRQILAEMTILNIETSTPVCSVALATDGTVLAFRRSEPSGDHARQLPLFVESMLAEARERGLKIDAVAVSEGPGSYTGLRIGVSMAKGLAYGLSVPMLSVQTLQILAAEALQAAGTMAEGTRICPMMDARRMEVYACVYDRELRATGAVRALVMDEERAAELAADAPLVVCGDGAKKCMELFKGMDVRISAPEYPDARFMASLSEAALRAGKTVDTAYFEPFYLKEFEAAVSHVKGLK